MSCRRTTRTKVHAKHTQSQESFSVTVFTPVECGVRPTSWLACGTSITIGSTVASRMSRPSAKWSGTPLRLPYSPRKTRMTQVVDVFVRMVATKRLLLVLRLQGGRTHLWAALIRCPSHCLQSMLAFLVERILMPVLAVLCSFRLRPTFTLRSTDRMGASSSVPW